MMDVARNATNHVHMDPLVTEVNANVPKNAPQFTNPSAPPMGEHTTMNAG